MPPSQKKKKPKGIRKGRGKEEEKEEEEEQQQQHRVSEQIEKKFEQTAGVRTRAQKSVFARAIQVVPPEERNNEDDLDGEEEEEKEVDEDEDHRVRFEAKYEVDEDEDHRDRFESKYEVDEDEDADAKIASSSGLPREGDFFHNVEGDQQKTNVAMYPALPRPVLPPPKPNIGREMLERHYDQPRRHRGSSGAGGEGREGRVPVEEKDEDPVEEKDEEKDEDPDGKAPAPEGEGFSVSKPSGKPLPVELRKRVMDALRSGERPSAVAKRFSISRASVYRFITTAEETGQTVPVPLPAGGYRDSALQRTEIEAIARMAVEHPKMTAGEILREAQQKEIITQANITVNHIYRALKKANVGQKKLEPWDVRTKRDPFIVLERRCFHYYQRHNPTFSYNKLFFMDETFVRLNEQQTYGWGRPGQASNRVPKPKGRGQKIGLIAGIAPPNFIHYQILLPTREFETGPLYEKWDITLEEANEVKRHKGILIKDKDGTPLTPDQIKKADVAYLRSYLKYWGVKTMEDQKEIPVAKVHQYIEHLRTKGRVGLPKAGRQSTGGKLLLKNSTALDAALYFRRALKQAAETSHFNFRDRSVVLDNASTHGAPRTVGDDKKVSFLEAEIREELGAKGLIFTPPRSPDKNPVELIFSKVKHYVRHHAPDDGYTQVSLVEAIHAAFRQMHTLVTNDDTSYLSKLARNSGYVATPTGFKTAEAKKCASKPEPRELPQATNQNCNTPAAQLRRKGHIICANPQGLVIKEKRPGEKHWRRVARGKVTQEDEVRNIVPPRASQAAEVDEEELKRIRPRYAGYGVFSKAEEKAKANWVQVKPKSYTNALVNVADSKRKEEEHKRGRGRGRGRGPREWNPQEAFEVIAITDETADDYEIYWADGTQSRTSKEALVAGAPEMVKRWEHLKKQRDNLAKTRERVKDLWNSRKGSRKGGAKFYRIERIVNHRTPPRSKPAQEYLVKWEGYPEDDNMWVDFSNLSRVAAEEYWASQGQHMPQYQKEYFAKQKRQVEVEDE